MSKRGGFDSGPLSWVKGEIDSAFSRGGESLRAFAKALDAGSVDMAALKSAKAHLHQAHGALQIVGIGGIVRITSEIEALLSGMENDPAKAAAAGVQAALAALDDTARYLNDLSAGGLNQTLKLLPTLSRLSEARGAGKADPVELYYPEMNARPPARAKAGLNLHPEEVRKYHADQRARFMRGLLKFIKGDASGAAEMRDAVEAVELAQSSSSARTFWWVALACCDALARGALPAEVDARRACNRIEQQLRRLVEGTPSVPERLLREILYYVALAGPASEMIRSVQDAFQLPLTLPGGKAEEPAAAAPKTNPQILARIIAGLHAMETVLDAYYRDASQPLTAIESSARELEPLFAGLDEPRAAGAFAQCLALIRGFSALGYVANARDFEGVARSLSALGVYCEALRTGEADYEAIMRSAEGGAGAAAADAFTIEAQLAHDFQGARKSVEEWRKSRDAVDVADLKQRLVAIQKDAATVSDSKMEASALALLAEMERIPAATPAAAAEGAADSAVDAEMLQVYLEEAADVLETISQQTARLITDPGEANALVTIRRGFHTLKGSGRMVGLTRLGEAAWAVEQTLNLWLQEGRATSGALLHLIDAARIYFSEALTALRAGNPVALESELVANAKAVRSGEGQAATASAPAVAPPVASPVTASVTSPIATTESADGAGETVEIAGQPVSKSLFELFRQEAQQHITTLKAEHEVMKAHGVITDAMLLAVHTLSGIAGTVQVDNLRDFAGVFDRALTQLSLAPLSTDEEQLIEESIGITERMVVEALGLAEPTPAPDIFDRLEAIANSGSSEPQVMQAEEVLLPEEEAAIERDEEGNAILPPEPAPPASSGPAVVEVDDSPAAERRQKRMSDEIDAQLLPVFLEEANELVPALSESLRAWHASPEDKALGQAVKRVLHTLKGSARMAGAMSVGELSHHMESRIEKSLELPVIPASLFEELDTSMDRMGFLFDKIDPAGGPAKQAAHRIAPAAALAEAPRAAPGAAAPARLAMLRVRADLVDKLVNEAGEVAIARSRIEEETRALRESIKELTGNVARLRTLLRDIEIQAESQMQSRMDEAHAANREFDPLQFDRFTRFQELTRQMAEAVNDVQTVQQNLTGAMETTDTALAAQARLNRDLQQDLMRVRMLPVSSIAERLYRVVRQSAKEIGKRANLDINGGQVELDRSVLERITAPLEHMLRNSVTHGIESPEARAAAGKSPSGGIRLNVSQEGNEVLIALSDNGAGLDLQRIREKAAALNLIAGQSVLTDAEIADFIFLPGFSTAEKVTELAGRGVGMDVVRSEVASLGGRVAIDTERGQGTTFRIYLPLTLAVAQAMLIECAGQAFAIPAVMVERTEDMGAASLAAARAAGFLEWQGRRYPLRELENLLGIRAGHQEPRASYPVLFLRGGASTLAARVDGIISRSQEVVVKAIGPQLARVPGVSGATVLGSGQVVLIMNPVQLAEREAPEVPAADVRPGAGLPPLVMVVDDSLTVRKITGRLLERQGYRVAVARDGVEAVEQLAVQIPEVMLVDVEMPRMDGFELTRKVRGDERTRGIPIIMISSRTADKHVNYARDIGVDHFLGKPYQEEELLRHVAGFIAAVRAEQNHRE